MKYDPSIIELHCFGIDNSLGCWN